MFWSRYLGVNNLNEGDSIKLLSIEYVLRGNILRQKNIYSDNQSQTKDTFGFKWAKRDTYESKAVQGTAKEWLVERYLGGCTALLDEWLTTDSKVLDAGCGAGLSALLFFESYLKKIHYLGVDISTAVEVAAERFREKNKTGEFLQADLLNLPFSEPVFDMIFSEGVLHHTDSTEKAIKYLSTLLVPGGRFLFYVYRKKATIREFADDYIRDYLKDMDDQQAWDALLPLTRLGKSLGDLNIKVNVPEAIPYLGIPSGDMDIQRLFYWYVFKAFYKPEWTLEEMNYVNFDWYRPLNCHRQTPEQVNRWCIEAGLSIERMDIQESGITVVATKR